ncbi:MAG: homoserine kinase [Endomicrobium sp.]|nr:homoserine kinase [Endomicrobium sp.]
MNVKIRVPATIANLGPGFDVFGAALSLYNEFEAEYVTDAKETHFILNGEGKELLEKKDKNLVWQAMQKTFELLSEDKYNLKNLNITINTNIPLSRGLGSSASAIVGGICLANALCKNKLNRRQIADLAIKIEGHPDNVVPAVYGGLCICGKNEYGDTGILTQLPIPKLKVVLCIPFFELRTKYLREILPTTVSLDDAVFNISRVAILTTAFCCGDYALLRQAMQDKIHQPYRKKMIPAMDKVLEKTLSAGAYGAFLSGSGPTLAALCDKKNVVNIQKSMISTWKEENVFARSCILDFDSEGVLEI